MDVHIDHPGRVEKLREAMKSRGIGLFLATRGKSVNCIAGPSSPGEAC